MKVKLNTQSETIVNEILRVTGSHDVEFVIYRALKMAAIINDLPHSEQMTITKILMKAEVTH